MKRFTVSAESSTESSDDGLSTEAESDTDIAEVERQQELAAFTRAGRYGTARSSPGAFRNSVHPDPEKTRAVAAFPAPKGEKAVRRFLGHCAYYRRFVQDFARISAPLTNLTKDAEKFEWAEKQQQAFDKLKRRLQTPPVLGHVDQDAETEIHTDANSGEVTTSRCEMFAFEELLNGSILIRNDSRVRCSNWEYDRGTHTNTLTNQFDLVCDRIWLRAASQSVYMVGLMVGNFFYAHLSDWYGRKRALAFMVPVPIVAGVMTAFSSSFLMLNIGRFISSLGIGGIQNTTFTFVMEVLSARHRALGSLISSGGWTTGLLTLVALAWFIRDWFHMQLVISLAYLLLALNWMFMSESPRWLLATSKYQEAERVLADAIKKNKIKDVQPEDIIKDFKGKPSQENTSKKPTFIELFRVSCIRWTTVNMCTMSILGTLLYYNLTYSSILLGGNPYVSFALMAAMEYPVRLISVLFINYIRRRPSYVILYAFSALCSVVIIFLPKRLWWLQLCFALLTKLGSTCAYSVNFVQLSELYPTKIRTLAMGFTITLGRVGAIIAPFTKELGVIFEPWAPKVVDIAICIVLAICGAMLPETFRAELPDTLEDIKQRREKKKQQESKPLPEIEVMRL
ncbi:organic cation transporter protein [Ixodes scapularis]